MAKLKEVIQSKDFLSGLLFSVLGIAFFLVSRDYPLGTARTMGPGYFPSVLAGLLALLGVIQMIKAALKPGERISALALDKLAFIIFSVTLFALALRPLGLALATTILVMISAAASLKFKWIPSTVLAVGLAAGSSIVFVKLLGLPIPIIGTLLGGR